MTSRTLAMGVQRVGTHSGGGVIALVYSWPSVFISQALACAAYTPEVGVIAP